MNMTKRPVPRYDFKAFGAAIKAARLEREKILAAALDEFYDSGYKMAAMRNIAANAQIPTGQYDKKARTTI
mgnify:CR=1 FL=1